MQPPAAAPLQHDRCGPRSGHGVACCHSAYPGVKIIEDSTADGIFNTAAEKRWLNNLRVPAPTTSEMIRKEKRQDNEILE
jgi:hypothetical protein